MPAAGRLMQLINLDQQATTPLAPEALDAMLPFLRDQHWNPHSAHRGGRLAKAALEAARTEVARLIGAAPETVIFTSGATEANNLALKGYIAGCEGVRRRLLTFAAEHSCVLETARHLERTGVPVTVLPVTPDGMPDLDALRAALGADVALVSAMRVNNEIGAIWPTAEICRLAHEAGALFHSDAAQAFGKVDCRLDGGLQNADMISISAHKIYGPKGVGALYVRKGVGLLSQMDGGGQEAGIRSGTQSPALAAGFGAAARVAQQQMAKDAAHCAKLMELALHMLGDVRYRINGPRPADGARIASNLSLRFDGVDSGRLMAALPEIALSSGAACSSDAGRPSHVLKALGLGPAEIRSAVRIGWGRYSTTDEITRAFTRIAEVVRHMQRAAA